MKISRHNWGGTFLETRGPSITRQHMAAGLVIRVPMDPLPLPAIVLNAVLTYPDDPEKLEGLIEALKAAYARHCARTTGRWDELPPVFRDYRVERIDAALRKVKRTWNESRLVALELCNALEIGRGRIMVAYRKNDYAPSLSKGLSGIQIDNDVCTVADAARFIKHTSSPQNISAKIWKPARPIIHLIRATANHRPEGSVLGSLFDFDWAPKAIRAAQYPYLAYYRENPALLDIEQHEFVELIPAK
jgi:hypothetical protein